MELGTLPIFFLDLQTTGSHPKNSEVLEIAWGKSSQGFRNYLITPSSGHIPYHIQKLTGITEEDLKDSRAKETIISELAEQKNHICVIHYSQFEMAFLNEWFQGSIPFEIICTHEIARRLFPNLPTRSLKGIAGFFGHQKEDIKRSLSHVEATEFIWNGLLSELEKLEIKTYEDLKNWLSVDFKRKKSKYEYPLDKNIRLNMSKSPGIYRMINKSGEILYVGKATSLHSRVNSYFRGQKNRDAKKLEMLTQVWNIQVTECQSPLEAALLETDEIKRLNPPYNISLKLQERRLAFFNHDFSSYSDQQDETHTIGPFSSSMVLDTLRNLSQSIQRQTFSSHIFYEVFPSEMIEEGFRLFCLKHEVIPEKFQSVRSSLALGLSLYRKLEDEPAFEKSNELIESEEFEHSEDSEDVIICAEDIAEKFERHFIRAALAYLRAQSLTKLLNREVNYPLNKKITKTLYFQNGKQVDKETFEQAKSSHSKGWSGLNVQDYDRMSVLYSELAKLKDLLDEKS